MKTFWAACQKRKSTVSARTQVILIEGFLDAPPAERTDAAAVEEPPVPPAEDAPF